MTKVRDVECGDRFYDQEFGYVIVTSIEWSEFDEVSMTVEYPAYEVAEKRRQGGTIYFGPDDNVIVVGKCVVCQQYKPYTELEYYNGVCDDCMTRAND